MRLPTLSHREGSAAALTLKRCYAKWASHWTVAGAGVEEKNMKDGQKGHCFLVPFGSILLLQFMIAEGSPLAKTLTCAERVLYLHDTVCPTPMLVTTPTLMP